MLCDLIADMRLTVVSQQSAAIFLEKIGQRVLWTVIFMSWTGAREETCLAINQRSNEAPQPTIHIHHQITQADFKIKFTLAFT